jgi:hypothetical protein
MEVDELVATSKKLDYEKTIEGYVVRFQAVNIRSEKTGIHAVLRIGVNKSLMAFDNLNIERNDPRKSLAYAAHDLFPETLKQLYDRRELRHDVDMFCQHVWPKWVQAITPSRVVGYTERIPPQFVLDPYMVKGGGTIIFGPPERMKTMTALTMAICVDAGLTWPFKVEESPVLYVNLERPAGSMQRRLGDLNRALGLQPDRPILMLNARGRSLADVEDGIAKVVQEEGVQVGFLDSISRAGYGDLNFNNVANQTIDIMNQLFDTWVGIAHSPRADTTHMYGSMHFEAGADIIVQLLTEYQDNRIGVGFQVVKANDMARPPLSALGFEFDDFGVSALWKPTGNDFPELIAVGSTSRGLTDEVKAFVLSVGSSYADEIAKAISRSRGSVAKLLSSSPVFVQTGREGHRTYYGIARKDEIQNGGN